MTRDTLLKFNLQGSLRKTTTIVQLADRSTVNPEGIVEDVMNPPLVVLPLEELVEETQANPVVDLCVADLTSLRVKNVEFSPERTLNINSSLPTSQEKELCNLLENHLDAFAWSYKEMKGVHPSVCTHHIYIKEDCKSVRQRQRRMNTALKDIAKEKLQKLLDAGFIYPIFDSEWVSLLVLVPKINGKWRIYVDYRELNKATKKYHFPFPFVDQVLDGLAGKKFFSFLDGFIGYNQIQINLEDQNKTTFTYPWVTFSY
eukprot:PITA_24747